MKKNMPDIFTDRDRAIRSTEDLLSKLWRIILRDKNIESIAWNNLMEQYLNDPRLKIPFTSLARSSARGNLNKELRGTPMTWKVFEKGIGFLRPVKAEFVVRLRWADRTVTEHAISMPQRGEELLGDETKAMTEEYERLQKEFERNYEKQFGTPKDDDKSD